MSDIIEFMSDSFKKVLATLALIIVVPSSVLAFFTIMYIQAWGGNCYNIQCNTLRLVAILGPVTLFAYIQFLKNKKDLSFWITVLPILVVIFYFLSISW